MAFEDIIPNRHRPGPLLSPENLDRVAIAGSIKRYLRRRFQMDDRRATALALELVEMINRAATPGEGP